MFRHKYNYVAVDIRCANEFFNSNLCVYFCISVFLYIGVVFAITPSKTSWGIEVETI